MASPTTDEAGVAVGQSVIARDITWRRSAQRVLEASQHRLAEAHQSLILEASNSIS